MIDQLLDTPPYIFNPKHIQGLQFYYDARQISGLADGAAISQWDDLSGNARHVTQGTAGFRPLYKVNILNGNPVVRFDGVDDVLANAYDWTSQVSTIFVVAKQLSGGNYRAIVVPGQSGIFGTLSASGNWGSYFGGDIASSYAIFSSFRIMCLRIRSGTDLDLITNGTVETKVGSGYDTGTGLTIGANGGVQFANVDIATVFGYNVTLSNANLNRAIRGLGHRFGIAIS